MQFRRGGEALSKLYLIQQATHLDILKTENYEFN